MTRRSRRGVAEEMLDLFAIAPWWASPVLAATAYVLCSKLIPSAISTTPVFGILGDTMHRGALWVALAILATGAAAALQRSRGRKLLQRQTGSDSIDNLSWRQFEVLLAAAYRRQGYKVLENGGGGVDGGVDLILYGYGEKILVQCKQWRTKNVGVKVVRELHGLTHSVEHAGSHASVVTFGSYTAEAKRFAKENTIELIDRPRLLEMIQSAQKSLGDASTPPANESQADDTPHCPICGGSMVVRTATKGKNAGNRFWGCTAFPRCRGTRNC